MQYFGFSLHKVILRVFFFSFFAFVIGCKNNTEVENNQLTFLHTRNQHMVNALGDTVLLKSIGLGNWLLPEGYMWKFGSNGDRPRKIEQVVIELIGQDKANEFWKEFRSNYITEIDIIRIKELGFNAVRPALNARLFLSEEENPQFVEEGFVLLDSLVHWCKKHQIYVIIDMHGAPGGQTGENIDDSPHNLPELFMDTKHQDALLKLWIEIASKYKNEPIVAAYDLLNEPLPGGEEDAGRYGHLVEPLYKRLTKEIRKIDPKHMITLEGVNWANDWSIFGQPFDGNTFYQFHYYCWDNPKILKSVDYYLNLRNSLNTPIWVGETGERDNTIYFGTTQYFEQNNIGWSFWPWKKMDTENTPYSINKPVYWDSIANYTRNGIKPCQATAEQAFKELIENIKLENCVYFEPVINALFHQIPVKVEAENYLQGKYNEMWFIADTSQKSAYYRINEFVPIELLSIDSVNHNWKWNSEQCIVLHQNEWVKYLINSKINQTCKIIVKVKGSSGSKMQFQFLKSQTEFELKNDDWAEFSFYQTFVMGENVFSVKVSTGEAKIDWIDIK